MPNLNISFNTRKPMGLLRSRAIGRESLRWILMELESVESGKNQSDGLIWSCNDDTALGSTAQAGPACGALIGSSLSGSVGATIDGTAVTVTAAGGDVATQTLLVAAIKANATVNRKVTASNRGLQLTLASVTAGQFIDICNTRFTAVNGSPANFGEFDMSGADAADATSLALAINRHPSLAMRVRAISSAAIVYIFPTVDRTLNKFEVLTNPGVYSTFTFQAAVQTALAVTGVMAMVPGAIGECCTVVASGTGMTYATANAGKLGNGTGGGTTSNFYLP